MVQISDEFAAHFPVCTIVTLKPCLVCRQEYTCSRFCARCAPPCRLCGAQRLGENLSLRGACCACEYCGEVALHREHVRDNDTPLICADCVKDSTLRCSGCGERFLDSEDEIGLCASCDHPVCSECAGVCSGCDGWRCEQAECQGCFECAT